MDTTKWNAKDVRAMNVDELQSFLVADGFRNSVTEKLKDEEINGICFLMLTDVELSSFQFKTGSKMRLRNIIEHLKKESVPQPNTAGLLTQDSQPNNNNFDLELETVNLVQSNTTEVTLTKEGALNKTSFSSDLDLLSTIGASNTPSSPASGSKEIDYNVIQILQKDYEGKTVVENYLKRDVPIISNEERIIIVRVAVNSLTTQVGNLYPTSLQKHALAEAIVKAFPCLKCNVHGVSPHCSFYNNKSNSFIETRLKTMRQRPNSKRRKYEASEKEPEKKKNRIDLLESGFETEKQEVLWMKERLSNAFNKTTIAKYMENTFDYRRLQIDSNFFKSASEILEAYPRFIDYDWGALIITEYYRLNKEGASFDNFENHYKDRIIALATCEQMGVGKENFHETSDSCLSALIYCVKLQPSVAKMKITTTMADVLEQLIVFRKENWDTHELENNRDNYSSQPFILCLGTMKSPSTYNVVIENTFIPCGESIGHAFKVLYSSFYCFRLQYPKRLHSFYRFFDDFVFKLTSKNKGTLMASCLAFEARLNAVKLPSVGEVIDPEFDL